MISKCSSPQVGFFGTLASRFPQAPPSTKEDSAPQCHTSAESKVCRYPRYEDLAYCQRGGDPQKRCCLAMASVRTHSRTIGSCSSRSSFTDLRQSLILAIGTIGLFPAMPRRKCGGQHGQRHVGSPPVPSRCPCVSAGQRIENTQDANSRVS